MLVALLKASLVAAGVGRGALLTPQGCSYLSLGRQRNRSMALEGGSEVSLALPLNQGCVAGVALLEGCEVL